MRDPAIMLFGHNISFPTGDIMDPEAENVTEKKQEADPPSNTEDSKSSGSSLETIVNSKFPSIEEEETENSKSNAGNSQDKTLKKPDKLLPCPRCNSMDTKFCYYNNYNVNQPRYFCKACQRYWTVGGTMRNVPVGAGRRKNKNSASYYPHITISEALQAARIDAPNGTHHPMLKTNGRVLSFGLDHAPICDSMSSVLNLGDKKVLNGATRNEINGFEDRRFHVPCKSGENNADSIDCSNTSTITVSCSIGESTKSTFHEPALGKNNGFIPQVPCIPSVPWAYPWNFQVPSPAFCTSGYPFPLSFYPAAFWNYPMPGSGPNSPTLGKHSRDGDMINQESLLKEEPSKQRNGRVLAPKTLRIDDPSEAAKSSIWATLGIKNESLSGGDMFKAFQSTKKDEKKHIEASPVLRANPQLSLDPLIFMRTPELALTLCDMHEHDHL